MSTLTTPDSEELIRLFELSDWQELALQVGDCELFLSKNSDAAASRSTNGADATLPERPPTVPPTPGSKQAPSGCRVVTAPSLGTFYSAAKRGEAAFVQVGNQVRKDSQLCLIQVMKRSTALRADVTGSVREVYAKDGDLVEFAQPLFLIDTNE